MGFHRLYHRLPAAGILADVARLGERQRLTTASGGLAPRRFYNERCAGTRRRRRALARNYRVSMAEDFYCDEVLSGRTPVERLVETDDVLAFRHTRPFYPVHVVVIPKRHVGSLLTLGAEDGPLLLELIGVIRQVAARIVEEEGACRVLTNLGDYQESKHLHWHVASGRPLK